MKFQRPRLWAQALMGVRLSVLGLLVGTAPALSQTSPGWYQGLVPTPAQWNAEFASKQDVINFGTDVLGVLEIPLGQPGSVLTNGGSGSGIAVSTTPVTGGTSGYILYDNGHFLGEIATTGTGSVVLSNSPTLGTPNLGTPTAINLTNGLSLPIAGVTGWGANVASAVAANWASNIQAFLITGWGANVAGAAETALNNLNGLVSYQNANTGSPPIVVNCTIPDSAAASTNWCPWEFSTTGVAIPWFDTLSVVAYATCGTNQPTIEAYNVSNSTGGGSTTVSNTPGTITNTAISSSLGSSASNAQLAFRVVTAGSGCSTTLGTEFITVSVTVRGG
jgi:hypothetical protein